MVAARCGPMPGMVWSRWPVRVVAEQLGDGRLERGDALLASPAAGAPASARPDRARPLPASRRRSCVAAVCERRRLGHAPAPGAQVSPSRAAEPSTLGLRDEPAPRATRAGRPSTAGAPRSVVPGQRATRRTNSGHRTATSSCKRCRAAVRSSTELAPRARQGAQRLDRRRRERARAGQPGQQARAPGSARPARRSVARRPRLLAHAAVWRGLRTRTV